MSGPGHDREPSCDQLGQGRRPEHTAPSTQSAPVDGEQGAGRTRQAASHLTRDGRRARACTWLPADADRRAQQVAADRHADYDQRRHCRGRGRVGQRRAGPARRRRAHGGRRRRRRPLPAGRALRDEAGHPAADVRLRQGRDPCGDGERRGPVRAVGFHHCRGHQEAARASVDRVAIAGDLRRDRAGGQRREPARAAPRPGREPQHQGRVPRSRVRRPGRASPSS